MTITSHFDQSLFRATLGSFATGVATATCRSTTGAPVGITINSFTSVSLQPPLILFCLSDRTRAYPDFIAAREFAINILAAGQENLSRHFAGSTASDWNDLAQLPDGQAPRPPLLAGCVGWLLCKKHAVHAGGDHAIIVGEVTNLGHNPHAAGLLYFRKQYRHL